MAHWSTPEDIRDRVARWWERGEILAGRIRGEDLFPREIPLTVPKAAEINADFGAMLDWVRRLQAGSRASIGHGYDLRMETRRSRVHGANALPVAALVPSEAEALRILRRGAEAERFQQAAEHTVARFPELRDWLQHRPLRLLEHADDWARVLAVLDWFRAHPRPRMYLRQLEIPGVDSKFIEARRGLLSELLDTILPPEAIDPKATGAGGFAQRYGLRQEPPLIRFRVLDPALAIHGLRDLSIPPEDFARLDLPAERIFITENRTNGLAFPDTPDSVVIFGLGYGLERLADIHWLHERQIHYWGDIDTHGFGILHQLRARFPQARSLLMDRDTLLSHRELWGQEPTQRRYTGDPVHLTDAEYTLYRELRDDRLGERVRLEQERIAYDRLRHTLPPI